MSGPGLHHHRVTRALLCVCMPCDGAMGPGPPALAPLLPPPTRPHRTACWMLQNPGNTPVVLLPKAPHGVEGGSASAAVSGGLLRVRQLGPAASGAGAGAQPDGRGAPTSGGKWQARHMSCASQQHAWSKSCCMSSPRPILMTMWGH